MKQFVMNVEPSLIKEVDEIIKQIKTFNSRNDFVRDAIRKSVLEYRKFVIRQELKAIGKRALKLGWNGEMPTHEERDKIAIEFELKNGFITQEKAKALLLKSKTQQK